MADSKDDSETDTKQPASPTAKQSQELMKDPAAPKGDKSGLDAPHPVAHPDPYRREAVPPPDAEPPFDPHPSAANLPERSPDSGPLTEHDRLEADALWAEQQKQKAS